jgi:hypothetical protein
MKDFISGVLGASKQREEEPFEDYIIKMSW